MFRVKLCRAAQLALALLVLATGLAKADVSDKKTIVTFSAPVEIPGDKVLPAGTYVFKLLDSTAERNIVQIFNKDETQLYATILGIPDYRDTPPSEPVIRFEERASGSPEAIKEWFYPGDEYGIAFVYPRNQAAQIAKRTNQHVLAMRNEMEQNITAHAKSANDQSVRSMQKTDVAAVTPSGSQADVNQAVSSKPKK
jgi:hypothetical protein